MYTKFNFVFVLPKKYNPPPPKKKKKKVGSISKIAEIFSTALTVQSAKKPSKSTKFL